MSIVYTKQHLLARLKKEGLPCTYKSLQKYERLGIIKVPESLKGEGVSRNWRFYSEKDMEDIVKKIKKYVENYINQKR